MQVYCRALKSGEADVRYNAPRGEYYFSYAKPTSVTEGRDLKYFEANPNFEIYPDGAEIPDWAFEKAPKPAEEPPKSEIPSAETGSKDSHDLEPANVLHCGTCGKNYKKQDAYEKHLATHKEESKVGEE